MPYTAAYYFILSPARAGGGAVRAQPSPDGYVTVTRRLPDGYLTVA